MAQRARRLTPASAAGKGRAGRSGGVVPCHPLGALYCGSSLVK